MKKILFSAVLFLLMACNKDVLPTYLRSSPTIESLFDDSTFVYDGNFSFTDERSLAAQSNVPDYLQSRGFFVDKKAETSLNTGAVIKLNGYETIFKNNSLVGGFDSVMCGSILGSNVTISSETQSGSADEDFSTTLYFPKPIHMNNANYISMGVDSTGMTAGSVITDDDAISWNEDVNNALGVIIFLQYDPNDFGNEFLKQNGYNSIISNYNLVTDNGSSQINQELLKDIPTNAIVLLRVIRGNILNYNLPNNPDKKVRFIFSTSEDGKFKYIKNGL